LNHQPEQYNTSDCGCHPKSPHSAGGTTEKIVAHIREWSINRVKYGITSNREALTIIAEFEEWIEPEGDELEILSLEEQK